jgi:hypothetical protein
LAGETKVLGENLPQRHFVHHKIPHDRPGLEPRTAAVGSQQNLIIRDHNITDVAYNGQLNKL